MSGGRFEEVKNKGKSVILKGSRRPTFALTRDQVFFSRGQSHFQKNDRLIAGYGVYTRGSKIPTIRLSDLYCEFFPHTREVIAHGGSTVQEATEDF